MTMFSETWNELPDRFFSYMIHYAGYGIFEPDVNSRIEQIKNDTNYINEYLFPHLNFTDNKD